jgi:hypothetical protein
MVCDQVLICDEGGFKEDSAAFPWCDPKLQQKRGAGIGTSIITKINILVQPSQQQQIAPPTQQQQISPPIEEQQQIFLPTEQQQIAPPNGQPKVEEQISHPNTKSSKNRKFLHQLQGKGKRLQE